MQAHRLNSSNGAFKLQTLNDIIGSNLAEYGQIFGDSMPNFLLWQVLEKEPMCLARSLASTDLAAPSLLLVLHPCLH